MDQALKTIGARFKEKRKQLNLSLKEVENSTSIRLNYIASIEEGENSSSLPPIYMNGFIKQYASFLGYDPTLLVEEFPSIFLVKPKQQEFEYGIGTLESRSPTRRKKGWGSTSIRLLLLMVTLALAYCLAHLLGLV